MHAPPLYNKMNFRDDKHGKSANIPGTHAKSRG